ncbi:MAG: DUF4333 domain-containing protein [Acidimicrobiales bacterium]
MIRPRSAVTAIALPALCVLVAGCGTKTIDAKQVEKQITDSQQSKVVGLAVTVSDAQCPSGQAAKKGTTFICTIKLNGLAVSYKATVDSVSSSQAHITTEPARPIINAKGLADQIAQTEGAGWTADCGAPIQQVDLGSVVTCKATNGAESQDVRFKVTTLSGTLEPVTSGAPDTTTVAPTPDTSSTTTA